MKKMKIMFMCWIKLISKINSGDSGTGSRVGFDKISDFAYFGHGNAQGWFVEGMEEGRGQLLERHELSGLLAGSFVVGCKCTSFSCNSGTTDSGGKTFADIWGDFTGNRMYGIKGKMDYGPTAVSRREVAKWWFSRDSAFLNHDNDG